MDNDDNDVCVCVCDDNVTIVMKTMDESMDGDDHDVCVSKRHKKPQGQRKKQLRKTYMQR